VQGSGKKSLNFNGQKPIPGNSVLELRFYEFSTFDWDSAEVTNAKSTLLRGSRVHKNYRTLFETNEPRAGSNGM
jgi:hypothetical protein